MANPVTENATANLDVGHPSIEVVQFTTASTGDYFDCKKLKHVDSAFACQSTTDGVDIQCSFALQSNGQPRVTLTLETGNVVTGYLIITGRL